MLGSSRQFVPATRQMMTMRFAVVLLLIGSSICGSQAAEPGAPRERGRMLAQEICAGCHAIGRADQSPHAGAPPFRTLDRRLDLDTFAERLRNGLTSGHPDMPTFRFTRQDARALVAYLRFIQGP
jgi:cytochrome c